MQKTIGKRRVLEMYIHLKSGYGLDLEALQKKSNVTKRALKYDLFLIRQYLDVEYDYKSGLYFSVKDKK